MENEIKKILETVEEQISEIDSLKSLDELRVRVLGKSGELTGILRNMKDIPNEMKPVIGAKVNQAKARIEQLIKDKHSEIENFEIEQKLAKEKIDVTLPSHKVERGSLHPTTVMQNKLLDFFVSLGFDVYDGPEIEYSEYNFDKLNIPSDHPARDSQDTFFINKDVVLRSQTSTVQIRVMENNQPPIKMVSTGRVYRGDAPDNTHSPVFNQMEGLVVDKGISMSDLQGLLETMLKYLFGNDTKLRFRPSFFPFTEPSVEVDITCIRCGGKGCPNCKNTGWIELLGAGMVHPNVLENCGIDSKVYSGFAFGSGVERLALSLYNIKSLKLLFDNDMQAIKRWK